MGEADGAIACPQRRFKYLLGLGDWGLEEHTVFGMSN